MTWDIRLNAESLGFVHSPSDPQEPLVSVKLEHGDRGVELVALADTGANISVFRAEQVCVIGIDVVTGDPEEVEVVGGGTIPGRFRRARISISRFGPIECDVFVTDQSLRANVVGRNVLGSLVTTFAPYERRLFVSDSMECRPRS